MTHGMRKMVNQLVITVGIFLCACAELSNRGLRIGTVAMRSIPLNRYPRNRPGCVAVRDCIKGTPSVVIRDRAWPVLPVGIIQAVVVRSGEVVLEKYPLHGHILHPLEFLQ